MTLEKIIKKAKAKIPKKFLPLTLAGTMFLNGCLPISQIKQVRVFKDVRAMPIEKKVVSEKYSIYKIDAKQEEEKLHVYLNKILREKMVEKNYVQKIYINGIETVSGPKGWLYTHYAMYGLNAISLGLYIFWLTRLSLLSLIPGVVGGMGLGVQWMSRDFYIENKNAKRKITSVKEGEIEVAAEKEISERDIKEIPVSGKVRFYNPQEIEIESNPLYVKKGHGIASLKVEDENAILSYNDFLKKPQVSMFKGMCNLEEVYRNLKKIPYTIIISYGKIKKEFTIKIKSLENLSKILNENGCF